MNGIQENRKLAIDVVLELLKIVKIGAIREASEWNGGECEKKKLLV